MSVRIDENTDHMKYTDDMEAIDSDIMDRVIAEMNSYDADIYTAKDVKEALAAETCSVDNFKAFTLIKNIYPLNPDIGERTTFCVLSIATIITHYL